VVSYVVILQVVPWVLFDVGSWAYWIYVAAVVGVTIVALTVSGRLARRRGEDGAHQQLLRQALREGKLPPSADRDTCVAQLEEIVEAHDPPRRNVNLTVHLLMGGGLIVFRDTFARSLPIDAASGEVTVASVGAALIVLTITGRWQADREARTAELLLAQLRS